MTMDSCSDLAFAARCTGDRFNSFGGNGGIGDLPAGGKLGVDVGAQLLGYNVGGIFFQLGLNSGNPLVFDDGHDG